MRLGNSVVVKIPKIWNCLLKIPIILGDFNLVLHVRVLACIPEVFGGSLSSFDLETFMTLQDPGRIPGRNIQEPGGILVGPRQRIQEVKRWENTKVQNTTRTKFQVVKIPHLTIFNWLELLTADQIIVIEFSCT